MPRSAMPSRLALLLGLVAPATIAACLTPDEGPAPPNLGRAQSALLSEGELANKYGVSELLGLGDVDADGDFDADDVAAIQAHVANPATALACEQAADANLDGDITAADVAFLQAHIDGLTAGHRALAPLVPGGTFYGCDTPADVASGNEALPGSSVPIFLLRGLAESTPGSVVSAITGPATLRSESSTVLWVDISASAQPGDAIDVTIGGTLLTIAVSTEGLDIPLGSVTPNAAGGSTSSTGGGSSTTSSGSGGTSSSSGSGGSATSSGTGGTSSSSGTTSSSSSSGSGGGGEGGGGTGGAGGEEDCPQRGNGCCSLLLSFFPKNDIDGKGLAIGSNLDASLYQLWHTLEETCGVNHWYAHDHKVSSKPQRANFTTDPPEGSGPEVKPVFDEAGYNAARAAWQANVNAAVAGMNQAIADHHTCIAEAGFGEGPETVIDVVVGHGGKSRKGSCGHWGTGIDNAGIWKQRSDLINANYAAVKGNTCDWNMFDSSCYSGLSVVGFAYVNNTGSATCTTPGKDPADVKEMHAGYESDTAVSTGTYAFQCSLIGSGADMINYAEAVVGGVNDIDETFNPAHYGSYYTDEGYTEPGHVYHAPWLAPNGL